MEHPQARVLATRQAWDKLDIGASSQTPGGETWPSWFCTRCWPMQHAIERDIGDRVAKRVLVAIVVIYLVLGWLYATATPAWQVPDEPAHYNYVKYVAENRRLPELRPGDYPHQYLEEIKRRRFPEDMSIEPIRYESHQPPLYYLLAAFAYRIASSLPGLPMPLGLRILSLVLGAISLVLSYKLVHAIYPQEPGLALGTAAFAATLPMHLAMTAAVNNDVLTELLLTLIVWQLVRMKGDEWTARKALGLGVMLGLAFLTKMQSYPAFGLALAALVWDVGHGHRWRSRAAWWTIVTRGAIMFGAALLVALPWLVRNAAIYGPGDLLGLARHDQVVVGQLTPRQYVAENGLAALLRAFVVTTFQSFWGQFGWMGVVLHSRFYVAWALLSGLSLIGLATYLVRSLRGARRVPSHLKRGLALLLVWAALTTLGYAWYNLKYVQHQGRYLFPALVPWGLAFTLGLREILRHSTPIATATTAVLALGLAVWGLLTGDFHEFSLLMLAIVLLWLIAGHRLERRQPGAAMGLVYLGMAAVSVACLYLYVVPGLRP